MVPRAGLFTICHNYFKSDCEKIIRRALMLQQQNMLTMWHIYRQIYLVLCLDWWGLVSVLIIKRGTLIERQKTMKLIPFIHSVDLKNDHNIYSLTITNFLYRMKLDNDYFIAWKNNLSFCAWRLYDPTISTDGRVVRTRGEPENEWPSRRLWSSVVFRA